MPTVRAMQGGGERIPAVVATSGSGRRRRPSGEPPPLPRTLARTTVVALFATVATVVLEVMLAVPLLRRGITTIDTAALRALAELRVRGVVDVADAVARGVAAWPVRILFWLTLALLVLVRRAAHHLAAYFVAMLTGSLLAATLALEQGRMRPTGVVIAGDWEGYAHPSLPVVLLALVLVSAVHTVVPAGRWRRRAVAVSASVLAVVCAARLVLAVDAPSDVLAALGLGWAAAAAFFGLALPEDAFPVRYGRGTRAHVDLSGARGVAVRQALQQQLGLTVTSLEPFGLAGSAGSMPMRLQVVDEAGRERAVFAKLYTVTHLRSDRWYKLVRMVLYGRLEDEKPFSTVRRLVEYEDHMLRLLRDAALPVPAPHGFVEITPEREYVVVMEFFDDARELGGEPLRDEQIDAALRVVRRLWAAGVAHRDVKPSNLLLRDDDVLLIDVAFATVRPTPWRQAVDLANMMLALALSSSADRVYERALLQFAAQDVAEAFAASRSVTVPTQLRERLRADGRDLASRFRVLAPDRAPVPIQLWSVRRVLVALAVLCTTGVAAFALAAYARVANLL